MIILILFSIVKNRVDFEAVVGRIEIDYLFPIQFGDEIEVFTRISKMGNKSVDVEHIIAIKKGSELINASTSLTRLVYYDYKNRTTKVIPEEAKETIAMFEGLAI